MAKGGAPSTEDIGVNRPPTLPIFPEADLPSAAQPGLLIGILQTSDGTLALGLSRENGTWAKMIDLQSEYPVGALYFNASDDTSPADILGFGTWEKVAEGRAIVGDDGNDYEAGDTGGSEEHQHVSTVSSLGGTGVAGMSVATSDWPYGTTNVDATVDRDEVESQTSGPNSFHNTSPTSSWPPYTVFHIWKRTA